MQKLIGGLEGLDPGAESQVMAVWHVTLGKLLTLQTSGSFFRDDSNTYPKSGIKCYKTEAIIL